jgi:TPR repeat protein
MKLTAFLFLPLLLLAAGCQTSPKPAADLLEINRYKADAERGDVLAQYNLGAAYASQWRPIEASQWFRKAADFGSPEAQYRLALNYFHGAGVPKSVNQAYAWFDVAAAQGHLLAVNARESLATRMTRTEVEAGERLAAVLLAKIQPQNLRYVDGLAGKPEPETPERSRPYTYYPRESTNYLGHSTYSSRQSAHYDGATPAKGALRQTDLSSSTGKR